MAVTGAIPLPKTGFNSFFDQLEQNKADELTQAKTKEAYANAAQSNMLSKLLSGESSSPSDQSSDQGGMSSSGMAPSYNMPMQKALMLAGALHLPTQVVEGNLITPFGTFKISESPEEKRQGNVDEFTQKGQASSDIKQAEHIQESTYPLLQFLTHIKEAKEILKRRKDLTGPLIGRLAQAGLSQDEDLARLHDIFGDIQTLKAKSAGTRGGAQLMNIVKGFKPDITKYGKYNLGMLDSAEKNVMNNISMNRKSYNKKSKQDLYDDLGIDDSSYGSENENQQNYNQGNPNQGNSYQGNVTIYRGKEKYVMPANEATQALNSNQGFSHEPG